jgi:hypothetical protein
MVRSRSVQILLIFSVIIMGFVAFLSFFSRLNIDDTTLGIDVEVGVFRGWTIDYEATDRNRIMNPPWSLLFLVPYGAMSFRTAWALMAYLTMLSLIISVPRLRKLGFSTLSLLLVVLSLPALRVIVDGNPEYMVTAGALFTVWGYHQKYPWLVALGVLMVSYKPQSSILLIFVLGVSMLRTWPVRSWIQSLIGVLMVVVPTLLWKGSDWWANVQASETQGSIVDSALRTSLARTGMFPNWVGWILSVIIVLVTLWVCLRTRPDITRERAGMLIAAMLLVSPYAAGNSAMSIYAVGAIPLFVKSWRWGLPLIVGANALYIMFLTGQTEWLFNYSAYYWTGFFLLSWIILGVYVYQHERLALINQDDDVR